MSLKPQSQITKHQASALRRTATAVRNLASGINDPTGMQKLLDAAAIIDAEAGATMQRSRQQLAEEKRYGAAKAKALPLARELVKQLPMGGTAEKLAILTEDCGGRYMIDTIHGRTAAQPTPARMQRELDEAMEGLAHYIAHLSAKTGQHPEVGELLMARLQRYSKDPEIAEAAALFDRINMMEVTPC